MSSFNLNNSSNTNTNNKQQTSVVKKVESSSFLKTTEEVCKYWTGLENKQNSIYNDITHLERMFHSYGSNDIFYQAKEILILEKDNIKKQMEQLEEQMFILKRNCYQNLT